MLGVYLILAGVWMAGVGYHDNSAASLTFLAAQKTYIVWVLAIAALYFLYQVDTLRPVVKPFIVLALVALILKDWKTIQAQTTQTLSEFGI